jgi:hypothetical protein
MAWTVEDWNALRLDVEPIGLAADLGALLHDVLSAIPGRRGMTVCNLGWTSLPRLAWLADSFGRVVVVDPSPSALVEQRSACLPAGIELVGAGYDVLAHVAPACDLVLALEGIHPETTRELDRVLEQAHAALSEGGLLACSLPAAARIGGPLELRLEGSPERRAFHEVELQYRLQRAGFQGTRIRRSPAVSGDAGRLLCLAARRAMN